MHNATAADNCQSKMLIKMNEKYNNNCKTNKENMSATILFFICLFKKLLFTMENATAADFTFDK